MASEMRSPGTAAGVVAILKERFKVLERPAIGRADAARLVWMKIASDGIRCERLDISDIPARRGSLFDMAGSRVSFPEGDPYQSCYVALIDPCADALWAHPAYWAFVPEAGDAEVVLQPTEFPEHALGAVRLRVEPRP